MGIRLYVGKQEYIGFDFCIFHIAWRPYGYYCTGKRSLTLTLFNISFELSWGVYSVPSVFSKNVKWVDK
jgi:hypothetical protein